jgi:hypothetical protein
MLNYLAALVVSHFVESAHTVVESAFTTVESVVVVVVSVVEAPPQEINNADTATIAKNFFICFVFV